MPLCKKKTLNQNKPFASRRDFLQPINTPKLLSPIAGLSELLPISKPGPPQLPNLKANQDPSTLTNYHQHPIPTVRSCDRGIHKPPLAPPARVSPFPASAGLAAPPNPSSPLRRPKQQDGEGTHRPARAALRPRHHPRIQEVQVEPVRVRLAGSDRGGEHQGGRCVVRRQEDGVRLQGQDQEQRHPLPLHLGQGLPPPRQHRRRPRQVHLQPPGRSHGAQGQDLHVPEQHLKV